MKIHDFNYSINIGNIGEEIILLYLQSNENILSVEEVQSNKYYQQQDIDYVVHFKNGTVKTVELKTDTYISGNIFFETMSAVETNSIGCMYKSKADYLFYYFINTKELYIFDFDKYREWFKQNKSHFYLKRLKNKGKYCGTYTSEGYTIPKTYLENNFNWYKKIIF